MIWGDQWLCPCGWYNLFVRKKCRNCGEHKLPDDKIVSVFQALDDAGATPAGKGENNGR